MFNVTRRDEANPLLLFCLCDLNMCFGTCIIQGTAGRMFMLKSHIIKKGNVLPAHTCPFHVLFLSCLTVWTPPLLNTLSVHAIVSLWQSSFDDNRLGSRSSTEQENVTSYRTFSPLRAAPKRKLFGVFDQRLMNKLTALFLAPFGNILSYFVTRNRWQSNIGYCFCGSLTLFSPELWIFILKVLQTFFWLMTSLNDFLVEVIPDIHKAHFHLSFICTFTASVLGCLVLLFMCVLFVIKICFMSLYRFILDANSPSPRSRIPSLKPSGYVLL